MAHIFKKLNMITTTQHMAIESNRMMLPDRLLLNCDDDNDNDNDSKNSIDKRLVSPLTIEQKKFIRQARKFGSTKANL